MRNVTKVVLSALIGFIHASIGQAQFAVFPTATPVKTPTPTQTPATKPTRVAVPDNATIRVVLTKVHGLGTAEYNASAKPSRTRGVRLVALVAGKRISADASGNFKVNGLVSQLDFELPSRTIALSTREDVCLDGLTRLTSSTSPTAAFELTFRGKQIAAGRYLASEILGCGDVVPVAALAPTATPTPKK